MATRALEDHEGAIDLVEYRVTSLNSAHLVGGDHFLRELVEKRRTMSKQIQNEKQHADIWTEALPRGAFVHHREFLLGIERPIFVGDWDITEKILVDGANAQGRIFVC